jgi:hypothetical protein
MYDRRKFLKWACTAALGVAANVPLRAAQGATKLLLVHGRRQQGLNPDTLKSEWMATLSRGAAGIGATLPAGLDVAFPFYGDKLDEFTRELDLPLSSDAQPRGGTLDNEFLAFQAEFAEAVRERAGVTLDQVDAEYGDNPQARGPLNWAWVQAILRALDKYGGGMNQKTLELFTRDVFLYTTKAGLRDEIDAMVAAELTEEPTVVVGHSLGSVVAYSVLRRSDRRALRVPLFVTVGSPLAVRAVRDQFRPLRSPVAVSAWYNAYDPRDVVALYPLDADNFPVRPAIVNYGKVRNSTDGRHGITGYLDDPEVAKHILDALGG